ncbi:MAG: hypothetical protein QXT25_00755 [Candidatus Anstonellaceae archaeon]
MQQTFQGQSSIEALVSFFALLLAISILSFSAKNLTESSAQAIKTDYQRIQLAKVAFLLDTAAFSKARIKSYEDLSWMCINMSQIFHCGNKNATEKLLHNASVDAEGKIHVQIKLP